MGRRDTIAGVSRCKGERAESIKENKAQRGKKGNHGKETVTDSYTDTRLECQHNGSTNSQRRQEDVF